MANVLVTGAAGFIGSHLCERLVADGHEVMGVDKNFNHNIWPLLNSANGNFGILRADLLEIDMEELVEPYDAVLHLAAQAGTGPSWERFGHYMNTNILMTHRILEASRHMRVKQSLVYVSSSSVYGKFAVGDEAIPVWPVSPYGVTKLAAERLAIAYGLDGLRLAVIRPFSVYGPRQRPDMYHHIFIKQVLEKQPITIEGDGNQSRSNSYVTDVVDAIVRCLEWVNKGRSLPSAFNIGGKEVCTILETIQQIEAIIGHTVEHRFTGARRGDQRDTRADCSMAEDILGWEPKVKLEEGLVKQIEWQGKVLGHG